jgi:hypothetical protein
MVEFQFGKFNKTLVSILIEAGIVGIGLFLLTYLLFMITQKKISQYIIIGIAGALFHIICEYTGVNVWYSKDYCTKI